MTHRVLTTGQVAQVFSVNINTVIKWFDDGKLQGFRLPRSNERRIYRDSVVDFMKEHDIAPELLEIFESSRGKRRRGRKSAAQLAAEAALASQQGGPEHRIFERKPVDLAGNLHNGDDRVLSAVAVRNLSMGGAFLTGMRISDRKIPEEFRLSIELGDGQSPLSTNCQLIHLRRSADNSMTVGCRFTQVDPASLQVYLASI